MSSKRFLIVFSCILLVIILIVANVPYEQVQEQIIFYYPRSEYLYGQPQGVIGGEPRDLGNHQKDLEYLLALYMDGPLDPSLKDPFPISSDSEILEVRKKGNALHLVLPDLDKEMTDSEFSLACACLTKTCLEYGGVQAVRVESGSRIVRMNHSNVVTFDESAAVQLPITEEVK